MLLNLGPHERAAEANATCAAQFKPQVGDYMITDFSPRIAPFQINTHVGYDYLVKLENIENPFLSLMFYVAGGVPFETRVPVGSYVLKYVAGDKWCGPNKLFGNQSLEKGRRILVFDETLEGIHWNSVTLYPVPNGNFATETLPISQF